MFLDIIAYWYGPDRTFVLINGFMTVILLLWTCLGSFFGIFPTWIVVIKALIVIWFMTRVYVRKIYIRL